MSFFNSELLFDTLIDSVSGVYWFNSISIHLADPSRTRHTFPNNQLGELFQICFFTIHNQEMPLDWLIS
jgi:hypothetical protein